LSRYGSGLRDIGLDGPGRGRIQIKGNAYLNRQFGRLDEEAAIER
jgi:hypothetical protein